MDNNCGVYKLTNIENGKVYIGSSKNLRNRLYEHRRLLANKGHFNKILQHAWNKYGEKSFEFTILEFTLDESTLLEREQWWMDKTQCFKRKFGYNLLPIAGSREGSRQSIETKQKISKTKTGTTTSEDTKKKISIRIKKRIEDIGKEGKEKDALSHSRSWHICSPSGKTFIIQNLSKFCRENGLSSGSMNMVSSGKRTHHKGWRCKKVEECVIAEIQPFEGVIRLKNWVIISPQESHYETKNLKDFCSKNGLNLKCMYRVASGERNSYKGWKCRKIEGVKEVDTS